jgi:CheY-like chemotaxis protein
MDPGGRIEVACKRENNDAVIRFIDHGRGLRPETIARLFEPFYQADQGLARSEGGLGLGLTLAKQLVELHGGTIEAQSDGLGQGSQFTVRLPAIDVPARTEGKPSGAPLAATAIRPLRVLIVDDSQDATMTMKLLLEIRGHEAATAANGPQALKAFDDFQPQVVLLDIGLPEMDGYEVAKLLRAKESGDAVKIIATTGYGRDEDRVRATEAGFDYHLTKPVNYKTLEDLLNTIREN